MRNAEVWAHEINVREEYRDDITLARCIERIQADVIEEAANASKVHALEDLRGMLKEAPLLYEQCLDTLGFAYHFNHIAKVDDTIRSLKP